MQRKKKQLTTIQTGMFVISIMLAMGILKSPRDAAELMKTPDIWLSVILLGIVALVLGRIIILLNRYYPDLTYFEYAPIIIGKWLGNLTNFIILLYLLLFAGYEIRGLYEVIHTYLLQDTPFSVLVLSLILIGIYLINGGIASVARLFEIVLPISLLFFILAFILSFKTFQLQNVRPVMGLGVETVLKGVPGLVLPFAGFEFMLFLNAFMEEKEKAWKAFVTGVSIYTVFFAFVCFMVVGGLGVHQVSTLTYPTIELFRSFEQTGIIVERYESYFLAVWIMQIFTTYAGMHYFASYGLSRITGKNIRTFIYGLAPVIFFISSIPANTNELKQLGHLFSSIQTVIVTVLIPLILGIAWFRNRLSPSWKK